MTPARCNDHSSLKNTWTSNSTIFNLGAVNYIYKCKEPFQVARPVYSGSYSYNQVVQVENSIFLCLSLRPSSARQATVTIGAYQIARVCTPFSNSMNAPIAFTGSPVAGFSPPCQPAKFPFHVSPPFPSQMLRGNLADHRTRWHAAFPCPLSRSRRARQTVV